jgi:trehalose 6-phosphate phosphatase
VKHLLSRSQGPLLEALARAEALVAFDFDGTLAPIVSRPELAVMRPRTRKLLVAVSRHYPCLVLSGRSRADLGRLLRGVGLAGMVGNHGGEPQSGRSPGRSAADRWGNELERRLVGLGVQVERKGGSVAVHYRRAPRKRAARLAILGVAGSIRGARLMRGKQVVDVLPLKSPGKGVALQRAAARLGCSRVLYVGDDRTDEDVFELDWPELVAVRIGRRRGSKATYFLRRQPEIDRLLAALLRLRQPVRNRAPSRARSG